MGLYFGIFALHLIDFAAGSIVTADVRVRYVVRKFTRFGLAGVRLALPFSIIFRLETRQQ